MSACFIHTVLLPERCRGSTHLLECHSRVWWDLEDLFFQAARYKGNAVQEIWWFLSHNTTFLQLSTEWRCLCEAAPTLVVCKEMSNIFLSACCGAASHRHVGSTASAAGFSLGVDETSTDAEIAQFDLTFSVQEDVWGFDVPVDDTVFLL